MMFVNGFSHSVKIMQIISTVSGKTLPMDFVFTTLLMIRFSLSLELKMIIIDKRFLTESDNWEKSFKRAPGVIKIRNWYISFYSFKQWRKILYLISCIFLKFLQRNLQNCNEQNFPLFKICSSLDFDFQSILLTFIFFLIWSNK